MSAAKIEQMAAVFARTWQRQPTKDELKGLIDDYVAEEVLVREALALGLDQDDPVIRRRLRQKMEFMTDAEVDALTPTDDELRAYLDANATSYEVDPRIGFEQVFLSPDRRGDALKADAAALLARLQSQPETDTANLGEPTLLPMSEPPTQLTRIGGDFGPDFASALADIPIGVWSGPITSTYGFHLVRVTERLPGRIPSLAEVHDAVLRDWQNAERIRRERAQLDKLLSRYSVTIDPPVAATTPP